MSFLWGAATSSYQIEGHNEHADWWEWEKEGRIEGGARCGAATDHRHRYKEDLRLASELGLNTYRFSVEWSRIEPEEDRFDASALDWYADLVAECERLGLVPMLTLHHFSNPLWFARQGGFSSDWAPERFLRFVDRVAERLGARIPLWCTFNEPMVYVVGTTVGGFMPPGEYAPHKAALTCRHILQSHVRAYDLLHERFGRTAGSARRAGPWKDDPLQVGIAHNLIDLRPARRFHPMERALTWVLNRFYNWAWINAVTGRAPSFGIPWLIPKPQAVPEALGRVTSDFIGVNYYTKGYVQWRPKAKAEGTLAQAPVGLYFARRGEPVSDMGWAIHPRGLGQILDQVWKRTRKFGLPIYVTENGIADHEDIHRTEYLRTHLAEVARAIGRGIPVRGYYYWSLLDNFEWIKGFGPRFGLYSVNYDTLERSPTRSARHYAQIIKNHAESGANAPQEALLGLRQTP